MEKYTSFIDTHEKIVRESMPAGVYLIRDVPEDMVLLLSNRFKDFKTEKTKHLNGKYTFGINISWRGIEKQRRRDQ